MPKIEEFCLFICFTAEAQRAQRENFFIKKLCDLCVSAVSYNFRHFRSFLILAHYYQRVGCS
jgi:hypothetical protein